jgi:hypothetical protein
VVPSAQCASFEECLLTAALCHQKVLQPELARSAVFGEHYAATGQLWPLHEPSHTLLRHLSASGSLFRSRYKLDSGFALSFAHPFAVFVHVKCVHLDRYRSPGPLSFTWTRVHVDRCRAPEIERSHHIYEVSTRSLRLLQGLRWMATGRTSVAPASRSRAAASVSVQRLRTDSVTRRIGSAGRPEAPVS